MTQQGPVQRFDLSRLLDRRVIGGVVAGVALLIALGLWVNDLVTPVQRIGVPTATVARPAPVTPTATPTPTATASPTGTASPQPEAEPTVPGMKASGDFDTSTLGVDSVGSSGDLHRFVVAVETTSKLKVNTVARQIAEILNDPRSWAGSGRVRFALVEDPKEADFTIFLSAPKTAARQCDGTESDWVCHNDAAVVINAVRWTVPSQTYAGDPKGFQRYLVNHGVGHYLGEGHDTCDEEGQAGAGDADPGGRPEGLPGQSVAERVKASLTADYS